MMPPDQQEIGELYDRYAHVIFLRARSILGSDEAAHDAVQETFARVIRNHAKFRGEASPLTWMYRITTNYCLNQIRNHKGRENKHTANKDDIVGSGHTTQRHGIEAERIRTLLAEADDETRAVVVHIYFDEMTREETAQMVGLSVPTVRKRLNAFLKNARKKLGVPLSAAGVLALLCLVVLS